MIKCAGYESGNPFDGYDFDCAHPGSAGIACDECIINGGGMSPITGKKFRGNPEPYMKEAEERWRLRNEH